MESPPGQDQGRDGVEVTVRGSHRSFLPAERGTITVRVGFEGADREKVVAGATAGTAALVAGIRDRHDPQAGPITWWSTDRLEVWSRRPYHHEGKQLPMVHHAATRTRAKFADLEELARWAGAAARYRGVSLLGIEWTLTERTRLAQIEAVRGRAVHDARTRAEQYAGALGLRLGRCVALADVGMLAGTPDGGPASAPVSASRAAGGGGEEPSVALTPEDVAVEASVDARFLAG